MRSFVGQRSQCIASDVPNRELFLFLEKDIFKLQTGLNKAATRALAGTAISHKIAEYLFKVFDSHWSQPRLRIRHLEGDLSSMLSSISWQEGC